MNWTWFNYGFSTALGIGAAVFISVLAIAVLGKFLGPPSEKADEESGEDQGRRG